MKAVYRIFVGLCIALFIVASLIGCGKNISSQAEAIQAASKSPYFKKLISAKSVYGVERWPVRFKVNLLDSNDKGYEYYIVHIIVYEDKKGNANTVCFDDQRPPKVITVKNKSE